MASKVLLLDNTLKQYFGTKFVLGIDHWIRKFPYLSKLLIESHKKLICIIAGVL